VDDSKTVGQKSCQDDNMIQRLKPKSEFSRNVLTLMTGTTIAQAIPIAISPILTRIYSPEDFGLLALFLAVFSILSIITTGRYELAIMSPESDDEAKDIVFLSILVAILVFFITTILIWFFGAEIAIFLGNSEVKNWLYFIPFMVLSSGVYQSIDYWLNRQKIYRGMAENKLIQASGVSILQLLTGVFSKSGLILGSVFGWIVSIFIIFSRSNIKYSDFRLKKSKKALLKYKDYPLLQAPSSLLNAIAGQSPVIFISRSFIDSTVGFFSLVLKILNAPTAIISKSIGQVFFQKVSEHANLSPHLLLNDIYSAAFKLAMLSVLLFSPIVLFGPELFSVVFGSEWIQAGYYAQILVFSIAVKFVVSPLSTIFLAIDRIKVVSIWQLAYFCITILVLVLATSFEFEKFLWVYVFSEITMYVLYFLLMLYTVKKHTAMKEL
jgi:O-antigen/teichoic acid export membrane protein